MSAPKRINFSISILMMERTWFLSLTSCAIIRWMDSWLAPLGRLLMAVLSPIVPVASDLSLMHTRLAALSCIRTSQKKLVSGGPSSTVLPDTRTEVIITFISRSTVQLFSEDPVAVTVAEASNDAGGGTSCFIILRLAFF